MQEHDGEDGAWEDESGLAAQKRAEFAASIRAAAPEQAGHVRDSGVALARHVQVPPVEHLKMTEGGLVDETDPVSMRRFFAHLLKSQTLPKHINTPERLLAAQQLLTRVGLNWLSGLSSTWVNPANNAIALCNDAPLAIVRMQPDYVATIEYHVNEKGERRTKDNFIGFKMVGAVCIAKRRNQEDQVGLFTLQEAQDAKLTGKPNWSAYGPAMLKMRARSIALRAQWADVFARMEVPVHHLSPEEMGSAHSELSGRERFNAIVARGHGDTEKDPNVSQDEFG